MRLSIAWSMACHFGDTQVVTMGTVRQSENNPTEHSWPAPPAHLLFETIYVGILVVVVMTYMKNASLNIIQLH